jgi:hypothetical protein
MAMKEVNMEDYFGPDGKYVPFPKFDLSTAIVAVQSVSITGSI